MRRPFWRVVKDSFAANLSDVFIQSVPGTTRIHTQKKSYGYIFGSVSHLGDEEEEEVEERKRFGLLLCWIAPCVMKIFPAAATGAQREERFKFSHRLCGAAAAAATAVRSRRA